MTLSIADIRDLSEGSSADTLRYRLLLWKYQQPDYGEWATLVESAISYEVSKIATKKNDLAGLSEDALTAVLILSLGALGLQASSARVGGNCDVTIGYRDDYLWLGEAKLFTGVAHVWDGYQQLTTRYATGMPTHSRGGMLLYCQKGNAKDLLGEWRETLRVAVPAANDCDGPLPLAFTSTAVSEATGMPIGVIHFAFPLFHDPKDGKAKLPKEAFAAGRASRKASKISRKT